MPLILYMLSISSLFICCLFEGKKALSLSGSRRGLEPMGHKWDMYGKPKKENPSCPCHATT